MATKFKRGDIVEVSDKAVLGGIPANEITRGGVGWVTRIGKDEGYGGDIIEVLVFGAKMSWWYQAQDLKKRGEATLPEE